MLSRGPSNARLRRSKSSASVKTRRQPPPAPEPFDPQAARQHALTAASLAMQRQTQRSSVDSGVPLDQSYGGYAEAPAIPRRTQSTRFSESGSSTNARSQYPSRRRSTREESLEPVPELPADGEFGFLEEDQIPSVPSSYKRLRKSKSMFSTRQRDSPASPRRDNRSSAAAGDGFTRTTLRQSLSFFRGKSEPTRDRHDHTNSTHDAAVQLAREQFLQALEEQQISEPSPPQPPRQQPRPFRKSFRSTSTDDTLVNDENPNERPRGSKSRLFSISIKNGIRRLFGRSSAPEEKKPRASMVPSDLRYSDTDSSNATVIGGNRTPRSQAGRQGLGLGPKSGSNRNGSLRTMRSSDTVSTASSRVSSWADSTAANTINTRHPGMGHSQLAAARGNSRSQQIRHTPSVESVHDGYSVFRQPLQQHHSGSRTQDVFDSQRVYSALMRQIDGSNEEKSTSCETTPRPAKSKNSGLVTPKAVRSVRHVPSSASVAYSMSSTEKISPSSRSQVSVKKRNYPRSPLGLTPQQVAQYNEEYQSQLSPYISKSTIIPEHPAPPETPPPFGHVVPSSGAPETGYEDDADTIIVSRSAVNTTAPQSPSVYSRTTSGSIPCLDELNQSGSSEERGTATILGRHKVEYSPTKKSGGRNWDRVTKGSAEWKQWMSSQMDIINGAPVPTSFSTAHYREDAQINDDGFRLESCTGGQPSDSGAYPRSYSPEQPHDEQTRQPLVELTPLSQNNFSLPLRRTPSGPMSIRGTSVRKPSVVTADHSPANTVIFTNAKNRSYSPENSARSRSPSKTLTPSPLAYSKTRRPSESPLQRDMFHNQNTAPVLSRYVPSGPLRYSGDAKRQSRGLPITPTRAKEDNTGATKENQKLQENTHPHRSDAESNLAKLENIHSSIGSKRMVDIFLSDRRRLMGSSEDGMSESAFL